MNASPVQTPFASVDPDTLTAMAAEDLVSLSEIAKLLGVSKRTVQRYLELDFPEPAARLATGRIWRRADVEKWGKDHLPLPTGRPPKDAGAGKGETA